jgi:mannose/fructose/N-acetylgalactosamine-specific phosphotransferase system component IID
MIAKNAIATVDSYQPLGGVGKIGDVSAPATSALKLTGILSGVIGFLTVVAVIYFIIQIILAGYGWITAGEDSGKLKEAQQKVTNSVLGLFIALIAIVLVNLAGYLLGGIDFLNLPQIINTIMPK